MKKGLALFDFDGTLTTHDTLLEIIKFQKGKGAFYLGFAVLLPVLILYKLKLIRNWRAKEMMLTYFFGDNSSNDFQRRCDDFIKNRLPQLLREEAVLKLEQHLKKNDRVIVVSASAYNWVEGWCKEKNIELIATRLQIKNNTITGKLDSLNCYGPEKASRIKSHLTLNEYTPIYAYGDSRGDKEMLALADQPFYRTF